MLVSGVSVIFRRFRSRVIECKLITVLEDLVKKNNKKTVSINILDNDHAF